MDNPVFGESITSPEDFFPDSTLERFNRILNSCNLSPKYFTLLALSPILTPIDELPFIYRALFRGTKYGVSSNPGLIMAGFLNTLTEIGFVSSEVTIRNSIIGYATTPLGEKYGKPIVAFVADFEEKYGITLFPILGSITTHSNKENRSPFSRATILLHLKNGEMTVPDLESLQKRYATEDITSSLDALEREKLITRKNDSSKKKSTYKMPESRKPSFRHLSRIRGESNTTILIDTICYQLDIDGEEINAKNVFDRLPEEIQAKTTIEKVNKQLYDMARYNVLEVKALNDKRSTASLTELGKLYVDELLLPILNALQDGNALNTMTQNLHQNYNNLESIRIHSLAVVDSYYPYSQTAKKEKRIRLTKSILELLKKETFAVLTLNEINTSLQIPESSLHILLDTLVQEEVLEKIKVGKVYLYAINLNNPSR